MSPTSVNITFGGQSLQLLSDRAILWTRFKTLIVADVHLGKAQTFRSMGVPVPGGTTHTDLSRLTSLIQQHDATRLIVLGDLFHALAGMGEELFSQLIAWRREIESTQLVLVRGNHDARAGDGPPELNMTCLDVLMEEGLAFTHHPPEQTAIPTLCGHVHPGARLADFDGSGVTVPCFVKSENVLILPAFGRLTGCQRVEPRAGQSLYIAAAGRVVQLPGDFKDCAIDRTCLVVPTR
jgi:uncharacterized protein